MRYALIVGGVFLATAIAGWSETDAPKSGVSFSPIPSLRGKTRSVRRDTPLRDENIRDREVLELEAAMRERYPGSVVYISAVTSGCPCEDGPQCTDQVWSVASRNTVSNELALSKIDGEWQVGPLQEWWLVRDRISATFRRSRHDSDNARRMSVQQLFRQLTEHNEAYPTCDDAAEPGIFF